MKILHLSDIHFGRDNKIYHINDAFERKSIILDELIDFIADFKENKIEHILVTGDIAWHGKKVEYDEALIWFKKLLSRTGLSGKDITFCVGNHDVNRAYSSRVYDYNDQTIEAIDEVYDYDNILEMELPIYSYNKFCDDLGVEPFQHPYKGGYEYSYSIGFKDIKNDSDTIRIVAFNTALLSFLPSISEDKMWIGQKQIKALLKYGVLSSDKYVIAMMHHPERFLHLNEVCEFDGRIATLNMLRQNVNLVLCGHTETGGIPVLQKQLGGAKLLTAGATYYNDTHPNSFSMLDITPQKSNDIVIRPFVYKNGWKEHENRQKKYNIKKIEELPRLGDIKETCKFVVDTNGKTYEYPMKMMSIYKQVRDGVVHTIVDNKKDVLRSLDVIVDVVNAGEVNFKISLSERMTRDVSSTLELERYCSIFDEISTLGCRAKCRIEGPDGEILIAGDINKSNGNADKLALEILLKIVAIERYYDIKIYRSDEIYEREVEIINIVNELIEKGYTEKITLGTDLAIPINEKDKLNALCEKMETHNSFSFFHKGKFKCILYGVEFSLGDVLIVSVGYNIDIDDLKYKRNTFSKGDVRSIYLNRTECTKTYFIVDIDKAKNYLPIMVTTYETNMHYMNSIDLHLAFIKEYND